MKKITLVCCLLITSYLTNAQNNVGIGTMPDPSAILDLKSDSLGLLVPRMTSLQRADINSPATSLMVFDSDLGEFMYFDGVDWRGLSLAPTEDWHSSGNAGTDGSDFIGTTDAAPLQFRVNNLPNGKLTEDNVFFGQNAGALNSSTNNIAIGRAALYHNVDRNENIAIGDSSLFNSGQNLMFGYEGIGNVAVGGHALYSNEQGSDNLALGQYSLYANTQGSQNVAVGTYALNSNETGVSNTALGYFSLTQNLSGHNNIAIGSNALDKNTIGNWNVGIGVRALRNNISGESNTGVGMSTLNDNTEGSLNTAVGRRALYRNGKGGQNVGIGYAAGDDYEVDQCTFIGTNTSAAAANLFNATAIGYDAFVDASDQIRVGNPMVTTIGGYVGWSNLSDARSKHFVQENVKGLDFILKLRPVTYQYDMDRIEELSPPREEDEALRPNEIAAMKAKGALRYTGFIAQEVATAAKEADYDFSGVDAPKNDDGLYSLRYSEFVVPLVKSMQEQQAMIEEMRILLKAQADRIKALELMIND